MKIVRLLSITCILSLLAACGSNTVTGPDAERDATIHYNEGGAGQFGSGN